MKASKSSKPILAKIKSQAPWPIPVQAQEKIEHKQGYRQIKFVWQAHGWRYEARFHQPIPGAQLIRYPSWRLDRVQPGKGFGPDHRLRQVEILAGKKWVPAKLVHYAAACLDQGQVSAEQIQLLQAAHFQARF